MIPYPGSPAGPPFDATADKLTRTSRGQELSTIQLICTVAAAVVKG